MQESGNGVLMRKHFLPIKHHFTIKLLDGNTMVSNKLCIVLCSTWYSKMEQGVTMHLHSMVMCRKGMTTSYHRTTGSLKSLSVTIKLSLVSDSIWVMDHHGTLVWFVVIVRLRLLTSQTMKWLLDLKPNQPLNVQLSMLSGSS
jgi:hypothetical protein